MVPEEHWSWESSCSPFQVFNGCLGSGNLDTGKTRSPIWADILPVAPRIVSLPGPRALVPQAEETVNLSSPILDEHPENEAVNQRLGETDGEAGGFY